MPAACRPSVSAGSGAEKPDTPTSVVMAPTGAPHMGVSVEEAGCDGVEVCEEVDVGVPVPDCDDDGVPVIEEMLVEETVCEGEGVLVDEPVALEGVPVSVPVVEALPVVLLDALGFALLEGEPVPVLVRVAELLGVFVRVAEPLEVTVMLGVTEALCVPDGEPDALRVEAGVCVALGVTVRDGVALPVRDDESVADELAVRVVLGKLERLAVLVCVDDGVPDCEDVRVPELLGVELWVPDNELLVDELFSDMLVEAVGIELVVGVYKGLPVWELDCEGRRNEATLIPRKIMRDVAWASRKSQLEVLSKRT